MKKRLLVAVGTLFLCGLTACMNFRQTPDDALFSRAADAMEKGKYDVARLSLQTLINTYPDSEYVPQAKKMLRDPRIPRCGEFAPSGSDCALNSSGQ